MKYLKNFQGYNETTNEGLKNFVVGAMMAISPLVGKSQDSKWIERASSANLHFWEKCKLASSAGKSGSVSYGSVEKYKNNWERMSDINSYDKDSKKMFKETRPEDIDIEDWTALNQEAARVSAVFSNPGYDKWVTKEGRLKYINDEGELTPEFYELPEEEQQSIKTGIQNLEPYFVYYKPIFPDTKRVTAQQLLDYWKSKEQFKPDSENIELSVFRNNLITNYRPENIKKI